MNILYLALGALRWYEAAASDQERIAPLVLLPVHLSRQSVQASFRVKWTEEEIEPNLSLETKLSGDFGIRLPGFADGEELDADAYFDQVAKAVSARERWSVDRQSVQLAFFSFSKLLIYKDLDPEAWPEGKGPENHPVIGALYGSDGFKEDPPAIGNDEHLDRHLTVSEIHPVMDSDSSQTLAVMDVKNGRNLVIQGPPGTGKSQTITNLLAEAIADNKKVLFVAEKMAALQVVKRRLDTVHIGDACLELHSHSANKRAVLDELKRTWALGAPMPEDPAGDIDLLTDRRERLNAYSQAVNAPVGENGFTPHQLIGRLSRPDTANSADWPRLNLDNPASWSRKEFSFHRATIRQMQALVNTIGRPRDHIFWGSDCTLYLPTNGEAIRTRLRAASSALQQLRGSAEALCTLLAPDMDCDAANADKVQTLLRTARRVIDAPVLHGADHRNTAWQTRSDELARIAHDALEVARARSNREAVLIPEAWEADVLVCRGGLARYGDKWWRILSGDYRKARSFLRGLCRDRLPAKGKEQLALVDAILKVQRLGRRIQESRELLAPLVRDLKPGINRESCQALGEIANWLIGLHKELASGAVDASVHDALDRGQGSTTLAAPVAACERSASELDEALAAVSDALELNEKRLSEGQTLFAQSFPKLEAWLAEAADRVDTLQDIARFNQFQKRLAEANLEGAAEVAAVWEGAGEHLVDLYETHFYKAWMELAFQDRPVLAEFDGSSHEAIIETFCRLDASLFRHNQAFVARRHHARLPERYGAGQVGTLMREFEKKRRHLPLRKLMNKAGHAIQQIKPVFMMSPLSIAKFIPPESVHFDLAVFDEASQVKPAEAMGAILRSKQVVVVGDSKQLPPTSFFDRIAEAGDQDDDLSATADLESILGMFLARGAPQRMLRWHYRSRHESLITVSNNEFYDNRLVVFPSPDKAREHVGLGFRHGPEAFYERGRGRRYNTEEARKVARAVMQHASAEPRLTLGVAAFSLAQARRIEDELEILRRANPAAEAFFAAHPEEPFFVKNLENVQGDERDVIMISIGYGKISGGYLPQNFGPLNRDGGERRLNVLITRARQRCLVYSNFVADDVDLKRTKARGVEALKTFLKYAETGRLDVPRETGRAADSPFEEAVADALRRRGHEVDHQVGSAGFFIDLAVVDPRKPGRYLLGIECDGASYHSARSARDRDRLRQQVLEGLGWRIHRIWSTDWFRNQPGQVAKTVEAIRQAAIAGGNGDGSVPRPRPPRRRRAPLERQKPPEAKPPTTDPAVPYKMSAETFSLGGRHLHEMRLDHVAEWVARVVEVESPIHLSEAALRVSRAAGLQKTGKRIHAHIRRAAMLAVQRGKLKRKGNFLWRPEHGDIRFRSRKGLSGHLRNPDRIAPEEIGAALLYAAGASHGIGRDDMVTEACRVMGFQRTGAKLKARFQEVLKGMIADGVVKQRGDLVLRGEEGSWPTV